MAAAYGTAEGQQLRESRMAVKPGTTKVRPIPREMMRRFSALEPRLQPSARTWVEQQARTEAHKSTPDVAGLEGAIRRRFSTNQRSTPNVNGESIEAIAFLVMLEAAQDMDKDLQEIMASVKAITNTKNALRNLMNQVNREHAANAGKVDAPCLTSICRSLASQLRELSATTAGLRHPVRLSSPAHPTYADLRVLHGQLKQNLDSMSELSQVDALRLQQMNEQRSRLIEISSDILKKVSDTSKSAVRNMK